jgi:hypothetical protein
MNERRSVGTEHPDFPVLVGHGRSVWTTVQTDGGFLSFTGLSIFDPWLAEQAMRHGSDLPTWVHQTLVRGAQARTDARTDVLVERIVFQSIRLRQTLAVMSRSKTANRRLDAYAQQAQEQLIALLLELESAADALANARAK